MTQTRLYSVCESSILKRNLIEIFLEDKKQWRSSKNLCERKATEFICRKLNLNLHPDDYKEVNLLVAKFRGNFQRKYLKYKGHTQRYFWENKEWLDSFFHLPAKFVAASKKSENVNNEEKTCKSATKRKRKAFQDLNSNYKRRKVNRLSQMQENLTTSEILLSASKSAKSRKDHDLSVLLKTVSENPNVATELLKTLKKPKLKAFTSDEALSLYVEQNLTQRSYKKLRLENLRHGADIYPTYDNLYEAKKRCRPDKHLMVVDDFSARVSLQGLLDHTTKRLVELQREVIEQMFTMNSSGRVELQLISSWGLDGSSSQSTYKQATKSEEHDESHLFATSLTPLRLSSMSGKETVVWNNDLPQSYRSCRPIHLQYKKETKELIADEIGRVQAEIDSLNALEVPFGINQVVYVSYILALTMVDGKVLGVATGTSSSQCCPLCKSKPTDLGNKLNIRKLKSQTEPQALSHGASGLHARIRFMEGLINVGIKLAVQEWRVRSPQSKVIVAKRKQEIEKEFWRRLHLRINVPKSGGCGNSNDGNTARRFFKNYKVTAKILGISEELVYRFRTILTVINCQLPIKANEFGEYCLSTHNMFVDLFPWYKMPATIHKILVHSREIVMYSILPLGMLNEEGAEARNKHYRIFRARHARKSSRKDNMEDVFFRSLETSDPVISSFSLSLRRANKSRDPLPAEVISFLKPINPDEPGAFSFEALNGETLASLETRTMSDVICDLEDLFVLDAE